MHERRRWIGLAVALPLAAAGWLMLASPQQRPFFDTYPRLDLSAVGVVDEGYAAPNPILGRRPGIRIYTWEQNWQAMTKLLDERLVADGWERGQVYKDYRMAVFKRNAVQVIVRDGKSVVTVTPKAGSGRLVSDGPGHGGRWVTLEHSWDLQPSLLDRLTGGPGAGARWRAAIYP